MTHRVQWIQVPFGDVVAEVDGREVGRVKLSLSGETFIAVCDGRAGFGYKTERAARGAVIKRLRQVLRREGKL